MMRWTVWCMLVVALIGGETGCNIRISPGGVGLDIGNGKELSALTLYSMKAEQIYRRAL